MKYFTLNQIWLGASFSIILLIPILFFLLNDQSTRHINFKKNISNDSINQKWRTRDLIKQKKFYIYLPLSIASSFISTGLMFHQIFIFNQKGWNLTMLGNGFLFLGIFSIVGLIIGGPIIDRFNTRKTVLTALLPLFLALLVLLFFNNYFFLLLYMSLYGLNHGLTAPFIGALWAEIYGVESLGIVKALLHAGVVFSSALSPLVFGYLIDFGFGISSIVSISMLIIIVSTLLPIYNKLP